MSTYSDAINPIRVYLGNQNPTLTERIEREDGSQIERWRISGIDIVLRITESGAWEVFVPVTYEQDSAARIAALERFLAGRRPDLDLLIDMANICDRFLARLAEFPSCNDSACGQTACAENRQLRTRIEAFRAKLLPIPTKEKSNVSA